MNEILIHFAGVDITPWRLVGYAGVLMFASRWFVQAWASKKAGKPTMPRVFWLISMAGSLLCLSYFAFGLKDSVGILTYLFPCCISLYNLYLDTTHRNQQKGQEEVGTLVPSDGE